MSLDGTWEPYFDERLYKQGNTLVFNFDCKADIDVSCCKTKNNVIEVGKTILGLCKKNKKRLPERYLIQRFIYLVVAGTDMDPSELVKEFDYAVGWQHIEWNT